MSLTNYKQKFDELSRFVLYLVDTKAIWAHRFERGLRIDIRKAVAIFRMGIY